MGASTELEQAVDGEVVPRRAPEQWAQIIKADLARAVQGTVDAGSHLAQAKAQIPHGGWEDWCRAQAGISAETARRLIEISQSKILANPSPGSHLPTSWRVLWELSRLPEETLSRAITAGAVSPDMTRKDVQALVTGDPMTVAQARELAERRSGEGQELPQGSAAESAAHPAHPAQDATASPSPATATATASQASDGATQPRDGATGAEPPEPVTVTGAVPPACAEHRWAMRCSRCGQPHPGGDEATAATAIKVGEQNRRLRQEATGQEATIRELERRLAAAERGAGAAVPAGGGSSGWPPPEPDPFG